MTAARYLVPHGYATQETLDQQKQQLDSAVATLNADTAAIGEAEHALDAATHTVELDRVNIVDNALVAPKEGPIEYRVANVGEVLAAGGKVFTMLDASYVYMDIYLPTAEAGRVKFGGDARIVLDAYPAHAIPAKVVFIASQAQFTPKTVETKDERDKLMFRIRVRIDPERLEEPRRCGPQRAAGRRLCAHRSGLRLATAIAGRLALMSERGGPVARLDNVTHRYGRTAALDGVTLAVPAGVLVGLVGPDGVGKSSLLAILAGARQIQSGTVTVLDGDMADAAHRAAVCPRIAYMPQGLGKNLYQDLSVRENIEFFARLFGQSRAEREISHRRAARQHRPHAVRRPPGEEAVGWHAAEARALLFADP